MKKFVEKLKTWWKVEEIEFEVKISLEAFILALIIISYILLKLVAVI